MLKLRSAIYILFSVRHRQLWLIGLLILGFVFSASIPLGLRNAQAQAQATLEIAITNTLDSGNGSIRQAIDQANSAQQDVLITFDPKQFPLTGNRRINIKNALPAIANSNDKKITISGWVGNTKEGKLIELNGSQAGRADGLKIIGKNVTIYGLELVEFGNNGLLITGRQASANWIYANVFRDNKGTGIAIEDGAANNLIGMDSAGRGDDKRNTITGNQNGGIALSGDVAGNVIAGNYIGTDSSNGNLGNQKYGVLIRSTAQRNFIGMDGLTQGEIDRGNLIVNTVGNGIILLDAKNQVIAGNTITGQIAVKRPGADQRDMTCGLIEDDKPETAAFYQGCGIAIRGDSSHNTIGVFALEKPARLVGAAARNTIAGNETHGLYIAGEGASGNIIAGNVFGSDRDGKIRSENGGSGIYVSQANGTIIGVDTDNLTDNVKQNLIAGSKGDGVTLTDGADDSLVAGNYIGLDACGCTTLGNSHAGIRVSHSAGNIIGADDKTKTPVKRNVISGNQNEAGIVLTNASTKNQIAGNYIGTDFTGVQAIPNNDQGILIEGGSKENLIGFDGKGNADVRRNVISGNALTGISIRGEDTSLNRVAGNYIGPNVRGDGILDKNASNRTGIEISDKAHTNIIGVYDETDTRDAGNLISGNLEDGIVIRNAAENRVSGNLIGMIKTANRALPNQIGVLIDNGSSGNFVGIYKDSKNVQAGNIVSGNTHSGIRITGSTTKQNTVAGNIIGLDLLGQAKLSNAVGLEISERSAENVIGVNDAYPKEGIDRNIISGNTMDGIFINNGPNKNVVAGNLIGLALNGIHALGNGGNGITIKSSASYNRIGSDGNTKSDALERNLIAGNTGAGIVIDGANNNQISCNQIGATIDDKPLPNTQAGIKLQGGAQENLIGGDIVILSNRIRFNTQQGISVAGEQTLNNVIQGNTIALNGQHGLTIEGTADLEQGNQPANNKILNNLIDSNKGYGISLSSASPLIDGNIITNNSQSGIYVRRAAEGNLPAKPTIGKQKNNAIYANCTAGPKDCAAIFLLGGEPQNMSTLEIDNPPESNHGAKFIERRDETKKDTGSSTG